MTKILKVANAGMGYEGWLVLSGDHFASTFHYKGMCINIHPVIRAAQCHAVRLDVPIGTRIAGIRWIDPPHTVNQLREMVNE